MFSLVQAHKRGLILGDAPITQVEAILTEAYRDTGSFLNIDMAFPPDHLMDLLLDNIML